MEALVPRDKLRICVGAMFGGRTSIDLGLADGLYTVLENTVAALIKVLLLPSHLDLASVSSGEMRTLHVSVIKEYIKSALDFSGTFIIVF